MLTFEPARVHFISSLNKSTVCPNLVYYVGQVYTRTEIECVIYKWVFTVTKWTSMPMITQETDLSSEHCP